MAEISLLCLIHYIPGLSAECGQESIGIGSVCDGGKMAQQQAIGNNEIWDHTHHISGVTSGFNIMLIEIGKSASYIYSNKSFSTMFPAHYPNIPALNCMFWLFC